MPETKFLSASTATEESPKIDLSMLNISCGPRFAGQLTPDEVFLEKAAETHQDQLSQGEVHAERVKSIFLACTTRNILLNAERHLAAPGATGNDAAKALNILEATTVDPDMERRAVASVYLEDIRSALHDNDFRGASDLVGRWADRVLQLEVEREKK